MQNRHKVLIMKCDAYDPGRIAGLIKEGMEELDVKPTGKIRLKPNVVVAHPETFPYAFTRSEFLDGALAAVKGCTVSVGDHVHYLSSLGKVPNVNFDPKLAMPLNVGYWKMRAHRAVNRLF